VTTLQIKRLEQDSVRRPRLKKSYFKISPLFKARTLILPPITDVKEAYKKAFFHYLYTPFVNEKNDLHFKRCERLNTILRVNKKVIIPKTR